MPRERDERLYGCAFCNYLGPAFRAECPKCGQDDGSDERKEAFEPMTSQKPPRGRPPGVTTAPVSTRLPVDVAARLLRLRLDHGYTVAEVVRAGVEVLEAKTAGYDK